MYYSSKLTKGEPLNFVEEQAYRKARINLTEDYNLYPDMVEAIWTEKKYGSYATWERLRIAWEANQSATTDDDDATPEEYHDPVGLTAEQFARLIDINHDGTIADNVTTTWGRYHPDRNDRMDRMDHRHGHVGGGGGGGHMQPPRKRIQYRRPTPYPRGAVIRFK